jgi:acyl dehydratase
MRFRELTTGRVLEFGPRVVSEGEIIDFASRYDPQPFHTDPAFAAKSRWGGIIASGWHTCCVAMELGVRGILEGSESYGSPGVEKIEWLHPVRPGDAIRLKVTILEQSVSSSKRTGIVRWLWEVLNQNGTKVASLIATTLFQL